MDPASLLRAILLDFRAELNARALAALAVATILCGCATPTAPRARLVWQSGFERGFPSSEWERIDNGSYSADGALPPGRSSAWTIVERGSGEPVLAGARSYKGWISHPSPSSHRAYPVLHGEFTTPLVNTFFVYLDADYPSMNPTDWIHLGTWGNYEPATQHGKWALHTLAVRDGRLEFAHTAPFHGEPIGALPVFPIRRWVRITVYMHYAGGEGVVQAWQDGKPVLRGSVPLLASHSGTHLTSAHWGVYASGALSSAVQYNDEIRLCALDAPLSHLEHEPPCPATKD